VRWADPRDAASRRQPMYGIKSIRTRKNRVEVMTVANVMITLKLNNGKIDEKVHKVNRTKHHAPIKVSKKFIKYIQEMINAKV